MSTATLSSEPVASPKPARSSKGRRLRAFGTVALAGVVAVLIATLAIGSQTNTGNGSGSASTGSVSLTSSATQTCSIGPMAPGDGTIIPGHPNAPANEVECQFTVDYTGSLQAYLGLSVSIASTHVGVPVEQANGITPAPAPGLYDSTADGLQLLIKDNQSTPTVYMNSDGSQTNTTGAGTDLGGTLTSGANPSASELLVSTSPFSPSAVIEFTIDYYLPAQPGGSTGNAYQAAASSVTLTVQAVQAAGNYATTNGMPSGTPCTAGGTCAGITWS